MTDRLRTEVIYPAAAEAVNKKAHRRMYAFFGLGFASFAVIVALLIASQARTASLEKQVGGLSRQAQDNAAQARTLASDGQALASQVRGLGGTPVVQPPAPSQIPGPQGSQGPQGDRGRGITGTQIVGGHLIVAYVDGPPVDVGQVAGPPGERGPAGRSIVGETLSGGHLILAFSDNTTTDIGTVVGKDGAPGTDGHPGRGVASSAIDARWHLIVTYDDHTSQDVGPLPPGPQGPAGPAGPSGAPGPTCPSGYTLHQARITADDGSSYDGLACVRTGSKTSATTIPPLPGR